MDKQTAAGQLETLARLLPEDGWGEHYIEAVRIGAEALRSSPDSGREAEQ